MNAGQNEPPEIAVYETRRFRKSLARLSDPSQSLVEDEIDRLITEPLLGIQKKGDLVHLRVHKFQLGSQEWMLGYNWDEGELTIHLLQLGSHENYYRDAKVARKSDLKMIKS